MWTQERIKRFWEACGFKFFRPYKGGAIDVISPDGKCYLSPSSEAMPDIAGLIALFKWAVPRLKSWECLVEWAIEMSHAYADGRTLKDPALALAEAIEKALGIEL